MMKKVKFDLRWFLIFASVAVEIPRFAGMFLSADVAKVDDWLSVGLHWGSTFSGLAMGVLYSIGAMYLSHGLVKSFQNKNLSEIKKMLNLKFIALIAITATIIYMAIELLTPYTVSRMTGETLAQALGTGINSWARLASVAPLLLMIGAFMSGSINFDTDGGGKTPEYSRNKNGKTPENSTDKTALRWPAARMLMSVDDVAWLASAASSDICAKFHLPEDGRLAREWRKKAAAEYKNAAQEKAAK
jgi:hypothetical protein